MVCIWAGIPKPCHAVSLNLGTDEGGKEGENEGGGGREGETGGGWEN